MQLVNIYQAKTQLSKLLEQVLEGEEVIIGKAGRPVARLVAYAKDVRRPGRLRGKIIIPDDFDEESEAFNKLFYKKRL